MLYWTGAVGSLALFFFSKEGQSSIHKLWFSFYEAVHMHGAYFKLLVSYTVNYRVIKV